MNAEKIRDIIVFTCNSLVYELPATWSVCDEKDCIDEVKKKDVQVKTIEPLLGYELTLFHNNEEYTIVLQPLLRRNIPSLFVKLPNGTSQWFVFRDKTEEMHKELVMLFQFIKLYWKSILSIGATLIG